LNRNYYIERPKKWLNGIAGVCMKDVEVEGQGGQLQTAGRIRQGRR